tara:strand:- start:6861 stop:7214 length:354 start_codon:yes stop_codon:yes gene_type:complete
MSGIRYVKPADRVEEQIDGPPGRIAVARDVSVNESETFGASIGTFENCEMEWTVLYDEYIYILEGHLDLETKDGTFNMTPGDSIWLPNGSWMIYRAEYAKAVIVVHPVNWRQIHGYD